MSTIGDAIDDIADEVRRAAAAHDHVITTGGVGPTHDDRTLEGVARAFGVELEQRDELLELLDRWEIARTEATLRMVTLPRGAELIDSPGTSYPVVRVRNVWIFPGVPRLLQAKFESVAQHFAGTEVACERIYCTQHETDIADVLAAVQRSHPAVTIGSYPRFGEASFRVILTLESRDRALLAAAARDLRDRVEIIDP